MDVRRKSWELNPDELERVAVGDPDPTLGSDAANGYQECRFEWTENVSPTVTLPWCCTRELGHQGQHLAGTGEYVAAVQAS
jgi:hypothetical protein